MLWPEQNITVPCTYIWHIENVKLVVTHGSGHYPIVPIEPIEWLPTYLDTLSCEVLSLQATSHKHHICIAHFIHVDSCPWVLAMPS